MAKLTPRDVANLRRKFKRLKAGGWRTATFLKVQARNYGMTDGGIQMAVYGHSWPDVDEPPYRPGGAT